MRPASNALGERRKVERMSGWRPPERVAGPGGLILDWRSWQFPSEEPAPSASIVALANGDDRVDWQGGVAQRWAVREAIGLSCRVWPRDRGRYVYLLARLDLPRARSIALRLGSYVGYRIWSDGQPIGRATSGEFFAEDENRFLVGWAAGQHRLLVELDRQEWQTVFHVRLSAPDGRDLPADAVLVEEVGEALARRVPTAFAFYNEQFNREGAWSLARLDGAPAASGSVTVRGLGVTGRMGEHNGGATPGRSETAGSAERAEGKLDWTAWSEGLHRAYEELLSVPAAGVRDAERLERRPWQGVWRESLLLHGGPTGPIPLEVLLPEERVSRRAALLCIHGHGAGRADVIGETALDPAQAGRVAEANYDYALQLARRGYVTFAADLRNFGERRDLDLGRAGRDVCDNNYFKAALLGLSPVALDLVDLRLVLDYALQQPEVDPGRIGCVGLSQGGRMTMYLSALDRRIRVAVSSGAVNTLRERLTSYAGCGSQLVPGLFKLGDTPEIFGLIAPRPLLLELGTQDGTSPEVYAAEVFQRVRHVYMLAGAEEKLETDIYARGHRFSGRRVFTFLERWLGEGSPGVPRSIHQLGDQNDLHGATKGA